LGTGVAARRHYWPALQQLRGKVELVACCNRTRSKAEAFAADVGGIKVYDHPEELLAAGDVNAVLVSLPIALLPKYVELALAAGKPVLSEKPLAPSVRAGQRLLEKTADRRVPWLVGENFAFLPQADALKAWLDAGRLGTVRLVEVRQLTFVEPSNAYFQTSWRQVPKHAGGFVVDGGVHLANVVRRCFGMPLQLENLTAQFNPALPPLDTAVAVMQFAAPNSDRGRKAQRGSVNARRSAKDAPGPLGTWTSCFSARSDGPMLRVYGELANAELGYGGAVLQPAVGEPEQVPGGDSFRAQFEHFYDVVKAGAPVRMTPEDALLDLRLIDAIARVRRR
jgi:predicted dehydrogenase